jgi:hypothetical protein
MKEDSETQKEKKDGLKMLEELKNCVNGKLFSYYYVGKC